MSPTMLLSPLCRRQSDVDWRAEHDLNRIPDDAACFQLGQVVRRMVDAEGPPPMTFRMEMSDDSTRSLRRCLIPGGRPTASASPSGTRGSSPSWRTCSPTARPPTTPTRTITRSESLKAADVVLAELNRSRSFKQGPTTGVRGSPHLAGMPAAAPSRRRAADRSVMVSHGALRATPRLAHIRR